MSAALSGLNFFLIGDAVEILIEFKISLGNYESFNHLYIIKKFIDYIFLNRHQSYSLTYQLVNL